MKFKSLGRIGGTFNATAWSYFGYFLCYKPLSNIDYNKIGDSLFGDYPLEYKIITGASLSLATFTPIIALGITDGLVDLVKGTHHYFGLKLWKRLTSNQKTKDKIDSSIDSMFENMEKPISFKASK